MTSPATLTDPAATNRLTYDDDLFLRTRRVLGVSVVNQTVWRLPVPLEPRAVRALHRGLTEGPLQRVVRPGRLPGARARWSASAVSLDPAIESTPVRDDAVLAWADRQAQAHLDPEQGPTWALAAAPTVSGGSVLSFVTSHVVADGGMHVGALQAAVAAAGFRADDTGGFTSPSGPRRLPRDGERIRTGLVADLRDATGQARAAVGGLRRAVRQGPVPPVLAQQSSDRPRPEPRADDTQPAHPPVVVVDTDAATWHRTAHAAGGTANSLLIAVCTEILLAAGAATAGMPVRVSVPVSLRGKDDLRSNATSGVSITVDTTVTPAPERAGVVADMAQIRASASAEFRALTSGTRVDTLGPLKPLMQMVPDAVAKRAARDATAPLCLASNLGRLPAGFAAPLGTPATSVLMRGVTQGLTRGRLRQMRGGLDSWWSEHDGVATLVVLGLDIERLGEPGQVRAAVETVYARHGLPVRFW
ncbi:hypothetical protein ACFQHV_18015 [Promicromonospora thailandica]|uniref:Uncharacterized protein n=1 Tax=Promicromonospora thailandica TaxID=765201 RepID=A0A9X2JVL4_9MICO|nr:hypothetical protein [Promicromonospora thailandica]MCP2264243.1 hypothetical protein [Promicromonospora thailandica]BFF21079.1 hypothetical protein GCM10025730_46000 [Promicromonospora thailandica]